MMSDVDQSTAAGASRAGRMLDRLVPLARYEDPDALRRARILAIVSILYSAIGLTRGGLVLFSGSYTGAAALFLAAAIGLGVLSSVRRGVELRAVGNFMVGVLFATCLMATLARGGVGTPVTAGLGIAILLAVLLAGIRSGLFWAACSVAAVLVISVLQQQGFVGPDQAPISARFLIDVSATLAIPLVILGVAVGYEWSKNAALQGHLAAERGRQAALQQAALARADRMASIGVLAAGIGHEINNPLSYVLGNLELLSEPDFEGNAKRNERKELLNDALVGTEQIRRVVKELMKFARQDSHDTEQLFDVGQALETAVSLTRNEVRHRASLDVDLTASLPVMGNEHRLVQVFVNLLINASHACMGNDGERGRIDARVWTEGTTTCASLTDSGPGIPEALQTRIFEPFFTTKPKGDGIGLGLSVSLDIVRNLGGDLAVESRPGRTVFTIRLPAQEEVRTHGESRRFKRHRKRLRILIVDDDRMVAESLARHLREDSVEVVTSGKEALRRLQTDSSFQLVVCDLMMPDLAGHRVHSRACRALGDRLPAFIFISGGIFDPEARRYVEENNLPILNKPLSAHEVHAQITALEPEV